MDKRKRYTTILCTMVDPNSAKKLHAIAEMNGVTSESDIAGLALELGIKDFWEMYRNNPKHAQQINEWEAKNDARTSTEG